MNFTNYFMVTLCANFKGKWKGKNYIGDWSSGKSIKQLTRIREKTLRGTENAIRINYKTSIRFKKKELDR